MKHYKYLSSKKKFLNFRYYIRVHGHTDIPTNLIDFCVLSDDSFGYFLEILLIYC